MYAFRSDIEEIDARLKLIEEAIGRDALVDAGKRIQAREKADCEAENHRWERIEYDLLQGKWGKDRCIVCGITRSWSYFGSKFSETLS